MAKTKTFKSCPRLKPYVWLVAVLIALWVAFLGCVLLYTIVHDLEMRNVALITSKVITSIILVVGLMFGGHWGVKAVVQDRADKQAHLEYMARYFAEQDEIKRRTYSLEIRAAGIAVDVWQQSSIWEKIKKTNNNFTSIYSRNPEDYPATADSRRSGAIINARAAARHSARDAVAYWPLPTFAIGPVKQPEDRIGAASDILSARNGATLGVNLFLWQDSENTTHAQLGIERLFRFMEANPEVPEALILSRDGEISRSANRVRGTYGVPNGLFVPTVFESMTGLLVARTDRVDRYLRPFAVKEEEDNQDKSTDLGKLWFFYWDRSRQYGKVFDPKPAGSKSPSIGPGTMSSKYWHAQLPELWKTISNRGPGYFEPTKWLPIRWAQHQIDEFDEAPILGYLHRPIKVSMTDENGKLLKRGLRVRALQAAWQQALDTLPQGHKPVRVFYDSTDNAEGEIVLNQALHALNTDGTGLDLQEVDEGYDIGRRLGNTGVSGALVEINLATIASYLDGGVSAVVYPGADGSATIQMIRPPDEATKRKNARTRWEDPFKFGAPSARFH